MGLEQFKEPIIAENIEDHERLLQEQMRKAQLLFTESEFQKEESKGLTYSFVLEKGTNMINTISMIYMNYLEKKEGKKFHELEEEFNEFKKKLIADIDKIAESTSGKERIDKVLDYIDLQFNEYYQKKDSEYDNHVGLIGYGKTVSPVSWSRQLENVGLRPDDDYLMIHLASAFKNNSELGSRDIKKWLSELAEIIIDKFPEAKAIVGISWLFDHPIMKRFGFKVVDEKTNGENWNQIINKDGQIDIGRLEYAIKNGRLPFRNLMGYILIEDFLKKYLPENRKGEIILKEVDLEHLEFKRKIQDEVTRFVKVIKETPQELLNIDFVLSQIPNIIKIASENGIEKEIKGMFEYCIENKIPLIDFDKQMSKYSELLKYKPFVQKISDEMRGKRYIEKKIKI